ncbi:MAG TPA: response regulator transcription factor [Bryobacteraceae bacterium]|nr:response regulator transcription factor [Bryobacteraceae bacterium]
MSQPIRILLVDDHGLFRESLSRLLQAEPDLEIIGNCSNVTEALAVLDREQVDLVLLDYDLGEQEGSLFLDSAKDKGFSGRVLMVTAGMSDAGTLRALENGASGIFLKHSPPAQLIEAIHKVMAGEMWLDSRAVRSLVAGASGRTEEQRTSQPLTPRERAVLKGVFEGLSNKEIAAGLEISEGSVKAVMQQLFDKTGVRTRSQLVRIALERLTRDWRAVEL